MARVFIHIHHTPDKDIEQTNSSINAFIRAVFPQADGNLFSGNTDNLDIDDDTTVSLSRRTHLTDMTVYSDKSAADFQEPLRQIFGEATQRQDKSWDVGPLPAPL